MSFIKKMIVRGLKALLKNTNKWFSLIIRRLEDPRDKIVLLHSQVLVKRNKFIFLFECSDFIYKVFTTVQLTEPIVALNLSSFKYISS